MWLWAGVQYLMSGSLFFLGILVVFVHILTLHSFMNTFYRLSTKLVTIFENNLQ
jgi:hypothetical protein